MTDTNLPLDPVRDPGTSEPLPAGPRAPVQPSGGRLDGVDLARALAVFGMFTVHLGPDPESVGGFPAVLLSACQGRSSALFATLAGLSLVLVSGRARPRTGGEGRRVTVRLALRAVILIIAGTGLTMLGTHISVIIPYYGVYFLLALPLLRRRARTLSAAAAVAALVGPFLTFAPAILPGSWLDAFAEHDPVNMLDGRGFIDLVLVGAYPAVTWMSYVFTGMALGRAELESGRVRGRLAVLGAALTAVGYGGSWLVLHVFTDLHTTIPRASSGQGPVSAADHEGSLVERLLVASPHSGTTFEQAGNIGVAVLVIVAALSALSAFPRLRRIARPVTALGTMSLSAYVAHILIVRFVDAEGLLGSPVAVLAAMVVLTTAFAVIWSRFFRRGPLEHLLHLATAGPAGLVR
ncbi:acyltransferase family protein [Sphaerisporangium fuscum]|uniref:acyltransferase family protein n=1 Tax=Sphaerisporangium fuscum TaxID=2835868 RepID=UPI001BDD71E3|nr:acyltransferase family protein [Sphaerisporangium fuscum]